MITGELKNKIDKLWLEFWQSGIANPLTVIEQITFLMFARLLDINEMRDEKREKRTRKTFKRRFDPDQQHLRWSKFVDDSPEKMMKVVRDEVFKHLREHTGDNRFGDYMKDARLAIEKPGLLVKAVEMINELPLESSDLKGDLYEYLLGKLTTAGINGQFRTPRHIIKLMVRMLDPRPDELVGDPACGTAGFLVSAFEHLLESHSSKEGTIVEDIDLGDGNTQKNIIYTGDKLDQVQWDHIKNKMFHGFDFDTTMLRIAAMNLVMHGIENPDIHYQDTLAYNFADKEEFGWAENEAFNVILANPPFKGALDEDIVSPSILRMVKTKKTELLFVAQILRMLKNGGRSATIVPQGVLFGSSKAHQNLRELLIEHNQLEAVINLPGGVFKPYAGVATAVLIFTKGGQTDHVWFYDVQDDGFSLDDKREKLYDNDFAGDMPKVLEAWKKRDMNIAETDDNDRAQLSFWVSKNEISKNKYSLAINNYKLIDYREKDLVPSIVILDQLDKIETDIITKLSDLRGML